MVTSITNRWLVRRTVGIGQSAYFRDWELNLRVRVGTKGYNWAHGWIGLTFWVGVEMKVGWLGLR